MRDLTVGLPGYLSHRWRAKRTKQRSLTIQIFIGYEFIHHLPCDNKHQRYRRNNKHGPWLPIQVWDFMVQVWNQAHCLPCCFPICKMASPSAKWRPHLQNGVHNLHTQWHWGDWLPRCSNDTQLLILALSSLLGWISEDELAFHFSALEELTEDRECKLRTSESVWRSLVLCTY